MAKSIISNDGFEISVSLRDRKYTETKASVKAISAVLNWATEMHGEDVSLLIDLAKTLATRRSDRREFQKNNPPESSAATESYKNKQRKYLEDFGATTEQIEALETKGHLGTPVVHEAIKNLVAKGATKESQAKVLSELLALD
jgi:ribonuclease HI|tara:strand:- start:2983 stop:3411 length:429 start_codon:yes stop_codon:yes gene_type:complete